MLIQLSPAKTLDFDVPFPALESSLPRFVPQSAALIELLRDYDPPRLAKLMDLSAALASLNVARYASWSENFNKENSRPAIFAFRGDVYLGLDAGSMSESLLEYAQDHLRILSGLYGLLRPLDLIQPYRLEMGTQLANPAGKDLYAYWGSQIAEAINADMGKREIVVNLASQQYFNVVDRTVLRAEVINPVFMDRQGDSYKVIGFFAKKARGLMARWILENRPKTRIDLRGFNLAGYRFSEAASVTIEPVFLRDEPQ